LATSGGEQFMKYGVGSVRIRGETMQKPYTDKQGQYLAFIYYYSKIHGRAPAEAEMQQYFRTSPPSVHQMVLTLETRGLIRLAEILLTSTYLADLTSSLRGN
jgi:hypothetical protein